MRDDSKVDDLIDIIEQAERLAVSAISCWDFAYLVKKKRLRFPLDLKRWMAAGLAGSGVRVINISSEIAIASAQLPDVHRDPADRLIIATALNSGFKCMSLDGYFKEYRVLDGTLIC